MNIQNHNNCIICFKNKLIPLRNYEKHNLIKCRNCGLVFMKQIPTKDELDSYYSVYSYEKEQIVSELTFKRYNSLLNEFEKFRNTNNMLDIGCGQGYFLEVAKKRGWNVFGTEYSTNAVKICENKGINMKTGMLNQNDFEPESFDIVTSFEVLEHINNPREEIKNIYSLLRVGGLFYCTTPNFNSLTRYFTKENYNIICYPEHLTYYTNKTLNKLTLNNGFYKYKFLSTGFNPSILFHNMLIKNKNEQFINFDEKIRHEIEENKLLVIIKTIINYFLTLFNLGLTLKGYFIKKICQ
ncbi:MAG: hypothetical protein A2046_14280 [Bacteroidetes bacterium GWA2_30_7]|nr:MAG: hypothetical protein A2046_14280 [Bacteroidetes bacterium GWA2_30_7]